VGELLRTAAPCWIRTPLAVLGSLACALLWFATPRAAAAGVPLAGRPLWFRDDYTTRTDIDAAATTAVVDTVAPGTVLLPYAPVQLALDPTGTYALLATQAGVYAFVFDGRRVRSVSDWRLGGVVARGTAWIADGTAFAIGTPSGVTVYGLVAASHGKVARQVAQVRLTGVLGLAPGPANLPAATLVDTRHGLILLQAVRGRMAQVSGAPAGARSGGSGVAATSSGAVAATWRGQRVQIWLWDGSAYLPAPAWSPPRLPPGAGTVVGVAFFPHGSGYWELTSTGEVAAFAYGPGGLHRVAAASLTLAAAPDPPAAIAAGWSPDALAVLYPNGWVYAAPLGRALAADPRRSVTGAAWPLFARRAVLQSTVLAAASTIDMVRVEDADCRAGAVPPACAHQALLPAGTSLAYAVGTAGCRGWTAAPPFTDIAVPPGRALCYRLVLRTEDLSVTPVVDVTDIYAIAAESVSASLPALLCQGASCRGAGTAPSAR
jgi:hypothetical protein